PTTASLHAYGNAVMALLLAHPEASASDTYMAIGRATDSQDPAALSSLSAIGAGYRAIALELLHVEVPLTLAPLHVKLINDYAAMAASYGDMGTIIDDPLRGLAAIQRYGALTDEAARVFTNIAQTLDKDGIIFNKDEPGASWSAFLSL